MMGRIGCMCLKNEAVRLFSRSRGGHDIAGTGALEEKNPDFFH